MGRRMGKIKTRGWRQRQFNRKVKLEIIIIIYIYTHVQNKWCTNAIAHHLMNNTQPISEQRSLPLDSSPSLYTGHDIMWYRIPLSPVWVSFPSCVPSQLPVHLAGQATMRSSEILDCLVTIKNFVRVATLFLSQIQNTALHQLPERELNISQPKPGYCNKYISTKTSLK